MIQSERLLIAKGSPAYRDLCQRLQRAQIQVLERDKRGYFGEASKFFNGYFKAIGVKVDKRVNFHSFRHNVTDAFRAAGYLDEQHGVLLGHTKASTTLWRATGRAVAGSRDDDSGYQI